MAVEKKQLIGGLNTDDSERLLELSDFVNMENLRIGGSKKGRNGRIENIPGTKLLVTDPFPGTNVTIGNCKDEARERIFYFQQNNRPTPFPGLHIPPLPLFLDFHVTTSNHILCYDKPTNQLYVLLSDDYIEAGGLNFNIDYPIDCAFVNGCIYWTDNLNPPRMLNVERAIKTFQADYDTLLTPYSFRINQVVLAWIRKPPVLPPVFVKQTLSLDNTGTGTGYTIRAQWYSHSFIAGPSFGALFAGLILRVTTPRGETWYGGLNRQLSNGHLHTFSLYNTNADHLPDASDIALLPASIDFTTLPAATAFGTLDDLMNYYSNPPTGPQYPHQVAPGAPLLLTNPVVLTNYPLPDSLNPNNFTRYDAFQFCWRYQYWNYELSRLSTLSLTANYNFSSELFDTIKIVLPFEEFIEQDVLQIDLVVKFVANVENNYFVIKSWKNKPELDGAYISDHNAQITPLTYMFDNSTLGKALDPAYCAIKSDLVPLLAETISPGKNRFYFGNYTTGYNTPSYSSLSASVRKVTDGNLTGRWIFIYTDSGATKKYFIKTNEGYYTSTYPDTHIMPPYPDSLIFHDLTKVANDPNGFAQYIYGNPLYANWIGSFQDTGADVLLSGGPPDQLQNTKVLKTDSSCKIGINFKDAAGRECGVFTRDDLLVRTKDRDYFNGTYETNIDWALVNGTLGQPGSATFQIPIDAAYYSIVITKCLRTRYFLSLRSTGASYVGRDSTGKNTYGHGGYAINFVGVAFDISVLISKGFGYVFTDGDLVKIWDSGDRKYTLKITATEGNWLITELQDLGNLVSANTDPTLDTQFLFEIFTPHKRTETESYWEEAQVFPVLNPYTPSRAYSVSAGSFEGDVSLLQRGDPNGTDSYLVEAMSPNDHYWNVWNTDAGKPSDLDDIGQVTLDVGLQFTNKFIPETRVNGLSACDPLDNDNLYEESGSITKLQLANKQQEDGTVLVAICKKGAVSIYLGETQLQSNEGDAFVAQSVGVIGTKNLLKGNNGCLYHTMIAEYLGDVYWFDLYNGAFCRYSDNGVYAISKNKASRYFQAYGQKYMADGAAGIKARNNYYYPVIGIDPFNGEVLMSLPATEDAGYCGQLPGFDSKPSYASSLDNRYDFYDGKAKTVAFKFKDNLNRWAPAHEWIAQKMTFLGMKLYGWNNGNLYEFETDPVNFNTTFGVQYPGRIAFVSNIGPSDIRIPLVAMVEGSDKPTFTHVYSKTPNLQSTDLRASEYEKDEGVYYADIKNNRLSLGFPDGVNAIQKRMKGDRIRAATPFVMMEWAIFNKPINIDFVDVGYRESSGHKI